MTPLLTFEFDCAFCEGQWKTITENDGEPSIAHSSPVCKSFTEVGGAVEFVSKTREELIKRHGQPSTSIQIQAAKHMAFEMFYLARKEYGTDAAFLAWLFAVVHGAMILDVTKEQLLTSVNAAYDRIAKDKPS